MYINLHLWNIQSTTMPFQTSTPSLPRAAGHRVAPAPLGWYRGRQEGARPGGIGRPVEPPVGGHPQNGWTLGFSGKSLQNHPKMVQMVVYFFGIPTKIHRNNSGFWELWKKFGQMLHQFFLGSTWHNSLEVVSSSPLNMYNLKRKVVFQFPTISFFKGRAVKLRGGVSSLTVTNFILIYFDTSHWSLPEHYCPAPLQKRTAVVRLLDHGGGVVLPPGGSSNTPASWGPWTRPGRGQEGFTQPAAGGGPLLVGWHGRFSHLNFNMKNHDLFDFTFYAGM